MVIHIKITFSFMDHIINTRKGSFGIAFVQVNIQELSTESGR